MADRVSIDCVNKTNRPRIGSTHVAYPLVRIVVPAGNSKSRRRLRAAYWVARLDTLL